MTSPLVIHHANCPDGFGAAWVMQQHLAMHDLAPEIVPANYRDPLPGNVDGRVVYVVDFCYEQPEMDELAERATTVTVFDHHKTALDGRINPETYTVYGSMMSYFDAGHRDHQAVLDMDHSGVGLAQQYTGISHPFLAHLEDRDLWRFDLEGTAEVFAFVTSFPYDMTIWDEFVDISVDTMIEHGAQIVRYRNQLIEQIVAGAWQANVAGHHGIWVAPAPYAVGSDVAGVLAERDPTRFAAYYVDTEHGTKFGLRSGLGGMDVEAIAKERGGGGHPHASGFFVPMARAVS